MNAPTSPTRVRVSAISFALLVAVPLLLSSACAAAHANAWPPDAGGDTSVVSLRSVDVSLVDESGHPLDAAQYRRRHYVAGEYGEAYSVEIRNRSSRRVEVVVSVDGRDTISGAAANYVEQRGYIVAPYETIQIEGFRQSISSVARFRFTSPSDAYASRMGTPENLGVIGVAVFHEREAAYEVPRTSRCGWRCRRKLASPPDDAPTSPATSAESFGGASRSAPAVDDASLGHLGTGYGEESVSHVQFTSFVRKSRRPSEVTAIYYDSYEALAAKGIHFGAPVYDREDAQPFPAVRFAPPPPARGCCVQVD